MKRITLGSFGAVVWLLLFGASANGQITNFYVSPSGTSVYPYTNWQTAANIIQLAVDAAPTNTTVWVTNGVYSLGGRVAAGSTLSNRVSISKALTLRSVNGPSKTIIQGAIYLSQPVRGVYLGYGTLDGFTVTNGGTFEAAALAEGGGGGIYASVSSIITNCIITGNRATVGGGVMNGIYRNCLITNNYADVGGGAAGQFGSASGLYGCTVVNNSAAELGGGAVGIACTNTVFSGNSAVVGGGAYLSFLQSCTLMNNRAFRYGGGTVGSNAVNCIIYDNLAMLPGTENYTNVPYMQSCCTLPLPPAGFGALNITNPPLVIEPGNPRLLPDSPCINAGYNYPWMMTNATDMEGNARIIDTTVDLGAYEYAGASSLTGTLSVAISVLNTQVVAGCAMPLTAKVSGNAQNLLWTFGDGTRITNVWSPSHAWSAPGNFGVTLRVTNLTSSITVTTSVTVVAAAAANFYVKPGGSDAASGTNWTTAKATIQAAVNMAPVGATVWVTNGTYNGGSQAALGQVVSNRVAVLWPLTVRSVSGPAVTIIEGANGGAGLTTRGVYLADGAVLSGFTVQKGTAATNWMASNSVRWGMAGGLLGGGILCETLQVIVTNCYLGGTTSSNVAVMGGGGYGGSYYNCGITNGRIVGGGLGASGVGMTVGGGGLSVANASGCTISGGYSIINGGGVFDSTAAGCIIVGNTAANGAGGGAYLGVYSNCVFSSNIATGYGGGASYAVLDNCTLTNNSVTAGGGGAYKSMVLSSLVAKNSSAINGGGLFEGNATNSIIRDNVAVNGGGIYSSTGLIASYQSCVIANNYADYGGGVCGGGGGGIYYQCTFTNNRAEYQGGAAYKPSQLYTCLVADNSARYGGGLYNGQLYRCTVVGNHAILQGGGVYQPGVVQNSIIYYNTAQFDDNWYGTTGTASYNCIDSPLPDPAYNNFTNTPGIISLDNPRLAPGSACYNAGTNQTWMTGQTDLADKPLIAFDISDIGAYEYQGASDQTGALAASISATDDNAVAGAAIAFTARTTGLIGTLFWNFGDGTSVTNVPVARHAWSTPGAYTVSLVVSNVTGTATVTTNVTIVSSAAACYVTPTGNDGSAGTSWATAKKTLQAAVDAAPVGATVWVTNGSYSTGGRPAGGQIVTNVVAVEKPVTLRSLNGPAVTMIVGSRGAVPLTNQFGVRGLYLGEGASLIGFTVTSGQAGGSTNLNLTDYAGGDLGGGIFCESDSSVVSNCVVAGNAAMNGGGVSGGTLYSSVMVGNTAWANSFANTNNMGNGGGAYYSRAYGCLVSSNAAYLQGAGLAYGFGINSTNEWNTNSTLLTSNVFGGGGFMSAFTNCVIRFNRSTTGGGIAQGVAQDCSIVFNTATKNGGGTAQTVNYGGAVSGNYAPLYGGGTYLSYNYNCLIQSNTASAGGGCYSTDTSCLSSNCVIADNRATNGSGGGSYISKTYNSMVRNNYASLNGGGQFDNDMRNCLVISNVAVQFGGGYSKGGALTYSINNSTFAYNLASTNGGGIYFSSALKITNSVIVSNSVAIPTNFANVYYVNAGTPTSYKSNLFYSCSTGVSDCVGSTTADPMFIDAATGNFRMAADSPCIDTGMNIGTLTNGVDLGGAPRLQGVSMDMGAYETFRPTTGAIVCTLTPSVVIPLGAQWSIDGGVWNDSGDVVGNLSAGSHTVSFSPVTGYTVPTSQPVTVSVSETNVVTGLYVLGSNQTQSPLVFNPTTPQVYGTTNTLAVSGGSGSGAFSFSVVSGPGLIVGGNKLTATSGTGTIILRATKAGDATYDALATTNTVAAAKTGQSISFPPIANQVVTATLPLVASSSSGLGVSFAVRGGPATLSAGELTFSSDGIVSVEASQPGDPNYLAATPLTNSFTVTNLPTTILAMGASELAFTTAADITDVAAQALTLSNAGLTALTFTNSIDYGEGASNWFSLSPSFGGLAVSGSMTVTGSVFTAGLYPGVYVATNTLTSTEATNTPLTWLARLTVTKATQAALVFSPASPQVYQTTNQLSVTGGAGTGTVSYAVLSGPGRIEDGDKLVITAGAGAVPVRATKAEDNYYNAIESVSTIQAAKATPIVTNWPTASSIVYGQTLANTMLSGGTASVDGGFAFSTQGTVPGTGTASHGVTFTPTDPTNYTTITGLVSVAVSSCSVAVVLDTNSLMQTYVGTARSVTVLSPTNLVVVTYNDSTNAPTDAGSYSVVATIADANYTGSTTNILVIGRAVLTVSADAKSRNYGASNAVLTASYTGWLNSDTEAVLGGEPGLATTATTNSPIGDYTITAEIGSLRATNYSFAFTNGLLTIGKATLTVAADNKSRIYGSTNPVLTASYSGWLNGDTEAVLGGAPTLTTTATTNSVVGTYTITPAIGTLTATNYSFAFTNGTLTVGKAELLVSADARSRAYGVTNPVLTASYSGYVNGETNSILTGSPGLSTTAEITSPVGGYPITVTRGTLASENYNFAFTNGLLTVGRSTLTVAADSKSRVYGAANPELTVSYTGWINRDTTNILTGAPSLTTLAVTNSPVGGYEITVAVGTLTAGNYDIVFTNGTLTVTQAVLTVAADNKSRNYGSTNPVFTASYTGWLNGDTTNVLSGAPSLTSTTTTNSAVGGYVITAAIGTLSATNYSFAFTNGTLTVDKAAMSIAADATNRLYGATNPVFTGTVVGVLNNDNITGLYTSVATSFSPVANYDIAPSLSDPDSKLGNYTVTTNKAFLSITKAPLLVIGDYKSRVYGHTNPVFTASYSGIQTNIAPGSLAKGGGTKVRLELNPLPFTGTPSLMTTADVTSPVGTHTITAALGTLASSNYSFSFTNGVLTVEQAIVTVAAENKSRTYGSTNPVFTASYAGWLNSDTEAVLGGAPSLVTTTTTNSAVGTYPITAAIGTLTATNYSFAFTNGTLTVGKVELLVSADAKSRAYGVTNPVLTASYSGFVNGETNGNLTGAPGLSTTAEITSPVGDYPITVTRGTLASENYNFAFTNGLLTVGKSTLTVAADSKSRVYGAANPELTVSYTGWINGDTTNILTGAPALTALAVTNSPVGDYAITVAVGTLSAGNYDIVFTNGTLTVTQAVLTVAADNKSRNYGSTNPVFTASYTGWLNGDTTNVLSGAPSLTSTTTTNSAVGGYVITAAIGTLSATNYSFAFTNGTLTVDKAAMSITADATNRVYGAVNPAFTGTVVGVLNNDNLTGLYTSWANSFSPVATYDIVPSLSDPDSKLGNYTVTTNKAFLSITKAPLLVIGDYKSRVYGHTNPVLTASYSGFVNNEGIRSLGSRGSGKTPLTPSPVTGAASLTTTADVASPVGPYTITAALGTLASANYSFSFTNGVLTVEQAVLGVTADNKSRIYGSTNPVLTASYSGWLNGDTEAVLGGAPSLVTTTTTNSAVGAYTITAAIGTLTATNYSFAFTNGTLTVGKTELLVSADAKSRAYGVTNPVLTASYSGFVNGETNGNLTGAPGLSTTAGTTSSVGSYPITVTVGTLVSGNYSFGFTNGLLTVGKSTLTVAADSKSRVYGAANPELTVSYTGWINGDTTNVLTGAPSLATLATTNSPIGDYVITAAAGTLAAGNYDLAFTNGTLSVTQAVLTVAADNKSRNYGSTNPVFTASYTGWLNGDTTAVLGGVPSLTTVATTNSVVGGYTITAAIGTLTATNYSFAFTNGTLTVNKAEMSITADATNRVYGDANPAFTGIVTGVLNRDNISGLYTTAATLTSGVGIYDIVPSFSDPDSRLGNYAVTTNRALLTVTKAPLLVIADYKSRVYGHTNPVFTASYSGFVNNDGLATLGKGGSGRTPLLRSPVTGSPSLTTTADVVSPVGPYTITSALGTLASSNYSFSFTNGVLTIEQALLTVAADNKSRIYGSTNPVFTASYTGWLNTDSATVLGGAPSLTSTATTNSVVGGYTITSAIGTLTATNYSFAFTNGTLTVNKAEMSITANATNRVYGDANPAFTGTVSGVVNSDNITGSYTTTATPASPVGSYDIVPSLVDPDGKLSNYTVTTNRAPLTLTKAALTAAADNKSRYYGRVNPDLTITYSGFKNSDNSGSLTTAPVSTTPAVQSSLVGTYPITAAGGVSSNYNFTYVPATITITKAPLLVVGDDATRLYGRPNPAFSAVVTGLTNNDNITVQFNTTATNSSPLGRYKISLFLNNPDGKLGQYDVTLRSAILTVEPGPLAGFVSSESRPYAGTNSPFTVTYSGWQNGEGTNLLEGVIEYACTNDVGEVVDSSTAVGSYPIRVITEQTATNYAVFYEDGTLTVTPVALIVTGDDATRVYGEANPTLTGTVTGQVNSDNITATFSTTAISGSAVGAYDISPVWNDPASKLGNYTITTNLGTLTVTKAPLSVVVDNKSRTYGAGNPDLTGTLTGVVNSDNITASYSTGAGLLSVVGSYPITASLNDPDSKLGNYELTNTPGTLTITKAPLGVVADNKSRTYGTANPTLTASYSGFVNSENATALGGSLSLTTEATASSPTGTYTITASGYTSGNYDISYTNGTLTVGSATLTVSGDNKTRVYGEANPALTGSLVGVVNGDSISAAWSTLATNNSTVGEYTISPVWTDPDGKLANYTISTNLGTLTITKAALTVTADNQSRGYGDANPTLTMSYSGFAPGDSAASLTTQPTCNVSATLTTIPGTYTITPSGATSSNYTISYVDGTLTVGKALLVIIGDDAVKNYGQTNPVFTASIVGIKNGDNLTFDFFTEATQFSLPGKYYIEILIGDGDGKLANYEVVMTGGRLTIKPAVLTGTIATQTRGYGANNSPFSVVYTGFVYPGDTNQLRGSLVLTSKTAGGVTVTSATAPGIYAIKATGKQSLTNYTVTYVDGSLTITQAVLTITGNNATRVYGSANPTLTASTTGFVNSETASVLGGSLTVDTTATVTSAAGTYAVTPSGYTSVNYAIHYVDGALTVTKAPLAGEITAATRAYGQSNPAYAVTYTGFLNGDTTNVLGSGLTFSCVNTNTTLDVTNNTPIGTYVVKAVTPPAATNYSITIADGSLTITQAVITVVADSKSRTYGASNPGLTGTLNGVLNGDNITAIYGTTAVIASPAGTYDIVTGLVDPSGKLTNYTSTLTSGTLTVGKAPLSVTADDKNRAYGTANPTLTVSYVGFLNGDTAANLGGTLSVTTPATASSPIGTYGITASGLTSTNYDISYTGGTLTIGKGTLTATADNLSRSYGSTNATLTGSLTGVAPGENITASYSTTANQASGVGAYTIVTTMSDPDGKLVNYNVSKSDGTLTVNKATLTATADNKSRIYGSLNPHLTLRYSGFVNGEDSSVLTSVATAQTTATTTSPVGTYDITVTGGSAANYELSRTSGTLTINKAAITVTVDNKSRSYGTANPTLTGTLSGVLNGDNITAFYATTAVLSSPAGTYDIVVRLVDPRVKLGNYTTSLTNGTLTVTGDDAPVVTLTNSPWLYTVGTAGALVDTNATVTDGGSLNFDGGTLTVWLSANGNVLDTLSYQAQGEAAGQIGQDGTGVTYGGALIGTVAGGTGTTPLVFSLNTNATPAAVQALLRAVTIETDDESTNSRTLRVVAADGDGGISAPVTKVLALNRPPVAGPDTYSVAVNGTLTNTIASVIANDTDADGDTVVLESFSGVSANGGRITQVGTDLIYRAPVGYRGQDLFAYLIADGRGGEAVGVMTINVGLSGTLTLNNSVDGMIVHLVGEAGKTYRIEATGNMFQWSVVGSAVANPDGTIEVLDTHAKGMPQRFYRAVAE